MRGGEVEFSRAAADRVLGLVPLSTADAAPHSSVNGDGMASADQIRAGRRSLGSDTTFVWRPPGTGKTTTLARLVEAHYRPGRSVSLVSNTNIAVDTALERVAGRLTGEPEPDFHQGLVIPQGRVVKEELRRRFGPQVILEEIVARLGERQQQEQGQAPPRGGGPSRQRSARSSQPRKTWSGSLPHGRPSPLARRRRRV